MIVARSEKLTNHGTNEMDQKVENVHVFKTNEKNRNERF